MKDYKIRTNHGDIDLINTPSKAVRLEVTFSHTMTSQHGRNALDHLITRLERILGEADKEFGINAPDPTDKEIEDVQELMMRTRRRLEIMYKNHSLPFQQWTKKEQNAEIQRVVDLTLKSREDKRK